MFTYVIVVVDGRIQSIERCELWIVVITVHGSCRFGGCLRLPEDDADALKHVGALTTFKILFMYICGPGSSVGIPTELRAGRYGIESPGGHQASCTMGTGSFPGVKCGLGVLLNAHPLLVPRSWKSRAIISPTLWATPDL